MTTVKILDKLKDFLSVNVCADMKLKKPSDKDIDNFELVAPAVHIGWIPPKGFLPAELETDIPCLVVGFDEDEDDGQEDDVKIRISAAVYSPGKHIPNATGAVECTPDFEGYIDLLNLLDRTKAEIAKAQIINGIPIKYPIKRGMYQETQPYPYWYGWISFSVKNQSYEPALIVEKYL